MSYKSGSLPEISAIHFLQHQVALFEFQVSGGSDPVTSIEINGKVKKNAGYISDVLIIEEAGTTQSVSLSYTTGGEKKTFTVNFVGK